MYKTNNSSLDALDLYIRDIRKIPQLTSEEEDRIARAARAGDEDARRKLAEHNLRFVVSIAKKYQGLGIDLRDLIGYGNEGLMRATRKFDPDEGVKFISYAVYWIRQSILLELSRTKPIAIPSNVNVAMNAIRKRALQIAGERGSPLDQSELEVLAVEAGISAETYRDASQARQHNQYVSIDSIVGEDSKGSSFGERHLGTEDTAYTIPETKDVQGYLSAVLAERLRPRERKVIALYFGLDGNKPVTLEEIGSMIGVTRERVRQIKEIAFSKIRRDQDLARILREHL